MQKKVNYSIRDCFNDARAQLLLTWVIACIKPGHLTPSVGLMGHSTSYYTDVQQLAGNNMQLKEFKE